jgi:hypothetical protein
MERDMMILQLEDCYIYIYLSNSHPITNSGTVRQDWSGRNGKRHDDTAT